MDPSEQQALLEQLRDVAAPAPVGWWPPAIGWWVLLAIVLLLLVLLFVLWKKFKTKHRKERWRRMALADHKRISESLLSNAGGATSSQAESQATQAQATLADLSVLMRRVGLAISPRGKVAALTDDNWLHALDVIGNTRQYSDGVGQLLFRAPYRREHRIDEEDMQRLLNLTESTIRQAQPGSFTTNPVSEDSTKYPAHRSAAHQSAANQSTETEANTNQRGGNHAAL